jgi:hypothetical protein
VGRALGWLVASGACGASPSGALGQLGDLGGRGAQNRSIAFGRGPGIGPYLTPGRSGSPFEAARRAHCALPPLGRFAFYRRGWPPSDPWRSLDAQPEKVYGIGTQVIKTSCSPTTIVRCPGPCVSVTKSTLPAANVRRSPSPASTCAMAVRTITKRLPGAGLGKSLEEDGESRSSLHSDKE